MRNTNEDKKFQFGLDQAEKVAARARYTSYVQAMQKIAVKKDVSEDKGGRSL